MDSWNVIKAVWRRTIRILARRGLVASRTTPVGAGLSIFGVIGKVIRGIGRGVRLSMDGKERDQRNKAETES